MTNQDVATSLRTFLSGLEATIFREADKLSPVTLRSVAAERQDSWESPTPDSTILILRGYTDLTLAGYDPEHPARIVTKRVARILTFVDGQDIEISNLVAGHHLGTDEVCLATVFAFEGTARIALDNVDLFGSSTHGLFLANVSALAMRDSVIRGCSQGHVVIDRARNDHFHRTRFADTYGYDFFDVSSSSAMVIENQPIKDSHLLE